MVAALARNNELWGANALLERLHDNSEPLPEALPPVLRRFLRDTEALPPWLDVDACARAQAWAQRHLVRVVISLFCAALPTAYAAADGAAVLLATGRMRGDLDRRVVETGRFVLDVLTPGAFGPTGRALRAAQKVRLIHAAVRHHLHGHPVRRGRTPLNQAELLGTLFCFSLVTLDAVTRLGVEVTAAEVEAYYQLWRAVGWFMGIDPSRLPATASDARRVANRLAARELRASEAGRELTAALIAAMEGHMPARRLRPLPAALARTLLDRPVVAMLGLGPAREPWLPALLRAGGWLERAAGPPLEAVLAPVGRALIEVLMTAKLQGRRPHFGMTTALPIGAHSRRA